MWVLHLINKTNPETKRPYGVYKVKNEINNYYSCCWNFDLERSKNLIGGMIYLHNSKSEKSFFVENTSALILKFYTPTSEV